jgi:hypothetical protein
MCFLLSTQIPLSFQATEMDIRLLQDRQCTYNVTTRRVRVTTVAVLKQ